MSKILIVDDELGVHEMLRSLFMSLDIEDEYVTNGVDALERYKKGGIDVVLTDVRMGRMDGLSLTQKLKEFDPGAVVILMTGCDRKEDILKALKLGAFDFFIKPFKINEFTKSLERAFRQRQASPEADRSAGAANFSTRHREVMELEARLERRERALAKGEALLLARERYVEARESILFERRQGG